MRISYKQQKEEKIMNEQVNNERRTLVQAITDLDSLIEKCYEADERLDHLLPNLVSPYEYTPTQKGNAVEPVDKVTIIDAVDMKRLAIEDILYRVINKIQMVSEIIY